jgi:hypothetical protein
LAAIFGDHWSAYVHTRCRRPMATAKRLRKHRNLVLVLQLVDKSTMFVHHDDEVGWVGSIDWCSLVQESAVPIITGARNDRTLQGEIPHLSHYAFPHARNTTQLPRNHAYSPSVCCAPSHRHHPTAQHDASTESSLPSSSAAWRSVPTYRM